MSQPKETLDIRVLRAIIAQHPHLKYRIQYIQSHNIRQEPMSYSGVYNGTIVDYEGNAGGVVRCNINGTKIQDTDVTLIPLFDCDRCNPCKTCYRNNECDNDLSNCMLEVCKGCGYV